MSRKVCLQVPVEITVRDRDVKALAAIEDKQKRAGSAVTVSLKILASRIDASVDTTRRALKSCVDEGYLTVTANCLENGGQIENSYKVTARGSAVVKAAREAGIV